MANEVIYVMNLQHDWTNHGGINLFDRQRPLYYANSAEENDLMDFLFLDVAKDFFVYFPILFSIRQEHLFLFHGTSVFVGDLMSKLPLEKDSSDTI